MRRLLFWFGIISPFVFIFLSSVAQHLTPGFDATSSPSSNLAAGQYGYLQNAGFVIGGLGLLSLGTSIYMGIQKKTKVAPLLVMLFGVILILSSIIQSNPTQTDSGTRIHIMLFMVGVIGMLVAAIRLGLVFKIINRSISLYSFLTAVVSLIGFIGIFATQGTTGLWQQIAVGPLMLWVIIIGIYTYKKGVI